MTIAGTYQHVRNENFVEYLKTIGLPEDQAKAADALNPKLQVIVDGRKITLKSDSRAQNPSSTFILGEEVDEPMPDGKVFKSTAELDGDTLTITSKIPSGNASSRIYKFSDAELVVTVTSGKGDTTARRIYKRI